METFLVTDCRNKKYCTFKVKNNYYWRVLDYLNYYPHKMSFTQVSGITAFECILKYSNIKQEQVKNIEYLTKIEWVYIEIV